MLRKCPYPDCDFEGETQEQVDEHVEYMIKIGDNEHEFGDQPPEPES